jgi:hypothetical protein
VLVRVLSVLALIAVSGEPVRAEEAGGAVDKGVFGAGLIIGEPTGISVKYYLGNDVAVDGALGAAFLGRGIQAHTDLLWHPWILDRKESFALPLYLGVGLRVLNHDSGGSADDHVRIGLRAPVGILFDFTRISIDVFAELAAVVDYRTAGENRFGLDLNGGAGVRYYF